MAHELLTYFSYKLFNKLHASICFLAYTPQLSPLNKIIINHR